MQMLTAQVRNLHLDSNVYNVNELSRKTGPTVSALALPLPLLVGGNQRTLLHYLLRYTTIAHSSMNFAVYLHWRVILELR